MRLEMESRDTTPEISPLRTLPGDELNLEDQEEGEISEDNLSEIRYGLDSNTLLYLNPNTLVTETWADPELSRTEN